MVQGLRQNIPRAQSHLPDTNQRPVLKTGIFEQPRPAELMLYCKTIQSKLDELQLISWKQLEKKIILKIYSSEKNMNNILLEISMAKKLKYVSAYQEHILLFF